MLKVTIWTLMPLCFSKPLARSRMPALAVTARVMTLKGTSLFALAGVVSAIITAPNRIFRIVFSPSVFLLFRGWGRAPHIDIAGLRPQIHHGGDLQRRETGHRRQCDAIVPAMAFGEF